MIGWFIGGMILGLCCRIQITREPNNKVYLRGFKDGYNMASTKSK